MNKVDKVDMSLDDIIKHNRKQKRQDRFTTNRQNNNNNKNASKQNNTNKNQQFGQKPKFYRNKNYNNNSANNIVANKQNYGLLNRSKTIKKKRPTVNISNNANGAIGNRGRNKQQQLNKFRLQRRRNNQNITNSQLKANLARKKPANSTVTNNPVAKAQIKPQNIFNRYKKTGNNAKAGGIAKKFKARSQSILKTKIQNRLKNSLVRKATSTVRFAGLAQKKTQTLKQPQSKLTQSNKIGVQQTARKNLIRAKRLQATRKGPLHQTMRFASGSAFNKKSNIRQNKPILKKPVVKLTSQLNANMLRINIKNNLQKAHQRSQQQIKSTKPIIKRNWKPSQPATSASNRMVFY